MADMDVDVPDNSAVEKAKNDDKDAKKRFEVKKVCISLYARRSYECQLTDYVSDCLILVLS